MKLITDLFEIIDKHANQTVFSLDLSPNDYLGPDPTIEDPHLRVADFGSFLKTALGLADDGALQITRETTGTPPPFATIADDEESLEIVATVEDLFSTSQKDLRILLRGIPGTTEADDVLEVELRATYPTDEEITIFGITWLVPATVTAVLTMTRIDDSTLDFGESREGSITLTGGSLVPVTMSKAIFGGADWEVALDESVAEDGLPLNLNDLAFLLDLPSGTGAGSIEEFIPQPLQDILFPADEDTQLRIHALRIDVNETENEANQYEIDLRLASTANDPTNDPNAWEIFSGLSLRQITLAFEILNASEAQDGRTVNFDVLGGIIIDGVSLPNFFTRGTYGDKDVPWTTGFDSTPSSTDTISVATLLGLIANNDLIASIPDLVEDIAEISLTRFIVTYNPYQKELQAFDVGLAKTDSFVLVPELPEVGGLSLELTFTNLNTAPELTEASLGGQILIQNGGTISLSLLRTDTGGWQLSGTHEADDDPSSFEDLLDTFIPGDIYWFGPDLGLEEGPNLPDNLEFLIYLNDQVIDVEDDLQEPRLAGDLYLQFVDTTPVNLLSELTIEAMELSLQRLQEEITPADPTNDILAVRTGAVDALFAASFTISGDVLLQISAALPASREEDLILSGSVNTEEGLPVGEMIAFMLAKLDDSFESPESLGGFVINEIVGEYRLLGGPDGDPAPARDKHIEFGVSGTLPLDNFSAFPSINFTTDHAADGTKTSAVDGLLILDFTQPEDDPNDPNARIFEFGLNFANSNGSSFMLADFHLPEGHKIFLNTVVGAIDSSLGDSMPDIELPLRTMFISYQSVENTAPLPVDANGNEITHQGNFLFGMALSTEMNFSKLPLVGGLLQEDETIGVEEMLLFYSTGDWTIGELESVNASLPEDTQLPTEEALSAGAHLCASVGLGDTIRNFSVGVGGSSSDSPAADAGAGGSASANGADASSSADATKAPLPAPSPDDEGKWFNINKQLGPLYIARIGLYFLDSKLLFVLDSEMTIGPLTVALDDLSFGSRLDRFAPEFSLRGLGLQFKKPPIEVSGLFLRVKNESEQRPGMEVGDRFAGAATIKTSAITISAIGEYASVNNEPSFYLYAYLGYPLGGPAFFFIEGLAAGFGYNRSVRLPEMDDVINHPMIAIVLREDASPLELADALVSGNYIPIDPGSIFLALGVRFTSFKLLDSFLMLAATFGNPFRIDLLGFSRLVLPPPVKGKAAVTPLAEVTLALRGTFIPAQGILGIQAQLTEDSYILSRDCTLQGGFAFFTWFAGSPYEGDFVVTLGGYHPRFSKPSHYPKVPRLGFNWILNSEISIKGGMYFALTPTAVMAGGRLEAVWESGDLKAWFIIGADFIISWKPYFYDARMYMNMGVSYTFWFFGEQTVSFDIGVDLHVWGPEFAGRATVDLDIVSFTVDFGDTSVKALPPLDWDEFHESFIPAESVSMSIAAGLMKTTDEGTWIINPNLLSVTTDSVIPFHEIQVFGLNESSDFVSFKEDTSASIGLAPMDIRNNFATDLKVTVTTEEDVNISNLFAFTELTKAVPKAIWGRRFSANMNEGEKLIQGALSGLRLDLLPPGDPDIMSWIDQTQQIFTINNKLGENEFEWVENPTYEDIPATEKSIDVLLTAFHFTSERRESLELTTVFEIEPDAWSAELSLSGDEVITSGTYPIID